MSSFPPFISILADAVTGCVALSSMVENSPLFGAPEGRFPKVRAPFAFLQNI
jgi:hypothetical protein